MKMGKKIIVFWIAYFLLEMSGNVFAEWYDEIAGKKISDYDEEITRLETKKDEKALQDLLKIFRDDLKKTEHIYKVARENDIKMRDLLKRYEEGSAPWMEEVFLIDPLDPFGISGISMNALSLADISFISSPKNKNFDYILKSGTKVYAVKDLIKKTEAALKQLGVAQIPEIDTTTTISSSSSSSTTSTTTAKPIHPQKIISFGSKLLPSPVSGTPSLKALQGQLKDLMQQKQDWADTFKTLSQADRQSLQQEVDQLDKQIEDVKKQIEQLQGKKVEKKLQEPKQTLSDEEMARQFQIGEYVERLNKATSLVDYYKILNTNVPYDLRKEVQEKTKSNLETLKAKAHPSVLQKYQ